MLESLKNKIPLQLRARLADYRGRGVYAGYPDKYKCIFIHIPKAAGTSVTNALFGPVSRHVPYFEYERGNPRKFAEYFKFTFVRNPWDRLLSAYIFLKKGGLNEMDRAWADENLGRFETFEQFVLEWVTEENIWSWVHFKPQHHFICDKQGRCMMDFVGRMETLAADFGVVRAKLGIEAQLSVLNRTRNEGYASHYTPQTREIVAQVYKKDIEMFNYSFTNSKNLSE